MVRLSDAFKNVILLSSRYLYFFIRGSKKYNTLSAGDGVVDRCTAVGIVYMRGTCGAYAVVILSGRI